jgi:ADP-heptose:LPS heptosyltransferase
MRPLFEELKTINGFVALEQFSGKTAMADWMRSLKIDAIAHLHPHRMVYEAAMDACVAWRAGYPLKGIKGVLTDEILDRRAEGAKHEGEYNFDLLELLGVKKPVRLLQLIAPRKSARESLERKIGCLEMKQMPLATLHPLAHKRNLRWPAKRFAALARFLSEKRGMRPVLIGADANDPGTLEFKRYAKGVEFLDLSGRADLAELAWLMEKSAICISRDTGPVHVAAAMDCPVVEIFGRTTPEFGPTRWRALGEKVEIVVPKSMPPRWPLEPASCHWRRSIEAITEHQVIEAAERALSYYR